MIFFILKYFAVGAEPIKRGKLPSDGFAINPYAFLLFLALHRHLSNEGGVKFNFYHYVAVFTLRIELSLLLICGLESTWRLFSYGIKRVNGQLRTAVRIWRLIMSRIATVRGAIEVFFFINLSQPKGWRHWGFAHWSVEVIAAPLLPARNKYHLTFSVYSIEIMLQCNLNYVSVVDQLNRIAMVYAFHGYASSPFHLLNALLVLDFDTRASIYRTSWIWRATWNGWNSYTGYHQSQVRRVYLQVSCNCTQMPYFNCVRAFLTTVR